jgi:two-component system, cell cycle response regulator
VVKREQPSGKVRPLRPTGRRMTTTQPELAAVRPARVARTTPPGLPAVREAPHKNVDPPRSPWPDDDVITEVGIHDEGAAVAPQATRRDRAVLLRMDGALAGQVRALGRGQIRMGRHPKNDLRTVEGGISRFHACIEWEDDGHTIEDLDSRNGTYVNGSAVFRVKLVDGDSIQLGPSVTFRYSVTDSTQEELLHRLFESSTCDALTGVCNRKHFEERLRAEIAYAKRHNADVALILFDIDHFKRINDSHGHQAGDEVLRQLAKAAARRLRTEDVLARFGGEEFAVILRDTTELAAGLVAERLRAEIAALPAIFDRRPIPVTISAGCASLEGRAERTADDLVAAADRRLYRAKHRGRNRVVATD